MNSSRESCLRASGLAALAAAAIACLPASARAEAKFSFDATPGRLPKSVVPLDYDIAIVPDAEAKAFRGSETIKLQLREPTSRIVFNSLNEKLERVRFDGKPVESTVSDDAKQLTTVTLSAPGGTGVHTLAFDYTGKIETKPSGLFVQPYAGQDGASGVLLSTQFEATSARAMFPCWDEPAFRASYRLSVTLPQPWSAVSNMPVEQRQVHGKLATTRFARTPKMSSYLLEFSAGDLAHIGAQEGATRLAVWAVRGRERAGAIALENARRILADYNEYFGYAFPLPKLDSIAIPGGFPGAMENWGAITYNDQTLLLDASSGLADRQLVFSTQAHEMAHQWYGDLVTMAWWDNLWLNESFASWMAAKETADRHPAWNWWEAQDESKEFAMAGDAHRGSRPIEQPVSDEMQAETAGDPRITYAKGQAVLRMLERYLGPEVFRDGIRRYMKDRAFSNATSADLWAALSGASGRDVGAIARDWIDQAGFPLVSVEAACAADGARTIRLTQRRFLLEGGEAGAAHWMIPLQIRAGLDRPPQALLLAQDGQTGLAGGCGEPLSVNADAVGFYRTMYDAKTLQTDIDGFSTLPAGDQIVLLDDQWALAEAGAAGLDRYLDLVAHLGSGLDARAWQQIAHVLSFIEANERGTPGHEAFTAYARAVFRPVLARLGMNGRADDAPGAQDLRRTVIADLGMWGDSEVIAAMRERFAAYAADRKAIAPDEQEIVLGVVARFADQATFDRLHAAAKASASETELRRTYAALMRVRDPKLAEQAARIALSDEIPPQAVSLRLQLIAELSGENPKLSWAALTANIGPILAPFPSGVQGFLAELIPEIFWRAAPLDEMGPWLHAHFAADFAPNIERGMASARFRVAEKEMLVRAADAYVAALPRAR